VATSAVAVAMVISVKSAETSMDSPMYEMMRLNSSRLVAKSSFDRDAASVRSSFFSSASSPPPRFSIQKTGMTNRGPVTLSIDEVDILLDLLGRPEPDESYHVKSLRTKVRFHREERSSGAGVAHTDAA